MDKQPSDEVIQAWKRLHQTHRLLLEKVENALKHEHQPPLDWYDVLLELYRAKNAGLRQYEIGEKVLLNKHNLSRLIDRLEKKALVERHTCAEDGRGNQVKITAAGEKLLKQMWPVYRQSIQEYFGSKLDTDECFELTRILKKVLDP